MVVILVFYAKILVIFGEKGYFMSDKEPITPQEQAELEIVLTLLRDNNTLYGDIAKIAKDLSNSIFRNRQDVGAVHLGFRLFSFRFCVRWLKPLSC